MKILRYARLATMLAAILVCPSLGRTQYRGATEDAGPGVPHQNMTLAAQDGVPPSAAPDPGSAFNEEAIRRIVDQRLQEIEAKKQAEEEQKKAEGYEIGTDLGMTATWNNGLEFATKNKDFRVFVGGRTQFDVAWFSADQNVNDNINSPYRDGVDFRRARLRVGGTMYETMEWIAEYDFMNSARVVNNVNLGTSRVTTFDEALTAPTDLWWTFKSLPVLGNLRIGNQKEPIGMEHLTSSRFLPFMERSFNQDTFYGGGFNGFTPGIMAFNTFTDEEMGTWALGLFKPCDNVFAYNANNGDYSVTGRLTKLLWYVDDGRGLLHVGVAGRQASTVGDRTRFRTRSAVRSGISSTWPVPADTGVLAGDEMQWVDGELAAVYGPWTLQAEYLVSGFQNAAPTVNGIPQAGVGAVTYHGGYVQVLYFLTGENDQYSKKAGVFERVKPNENFFCVRDSQGGWCRGSGAWQLATRYNYLDLNDRGINGGILHDVTSGLNWYLNPNLKIQFDYSVTYRDAPQAGTAGDGWIHGFGTRLAHDF